ncbi:DUF4268 domain-containing protein [Mycobacterium sp. NPDC049093]
MAERTVARLDTVDIADSFGWQVDSTQDVDTFRKGAVVIEVRYATDDDIESAVRSSSAGDLVTLGEHTAANLDQLRAWLGENQLQKQVGEFARSAGSTDHRTQLYKNFWRQFRNRVAAEHPDWKARAGTSRTAPNSTLPGPAARTLFVSAFKPGPLRLELAFVDPDPAVNQARFAALNARRDELERTLGHSLLWDEMTGKKDTRVCIESSFRSIDDHEQWVAMMDWLIEKHLRFKEAIRAVGGVESR